MSHPYNKKEWDDFAVNSLEGDKRLEELRKQVNQTALEKKQAHDQAMYPSEEAKAVAEATTAGQKASGTEPITPQQAITNELATIGKTKPKPQAVIDQELAVEKRKRSRKLTHSAYSQEPPVQRLQAHQPLEQRPVRSRRQSPVLRDSTRPVPSPRGTTIPAICAPDQAKRELTKTGTPFSRT